MGAPFGVMGWSELTGNGERSAEQKRPARHAARAQKVMSGVEVTALAVSSRCTQIMRATWVRST